MAEEIKAMQVQEQELAEGNGSERMQERENFIPRTDIYETEEDVIVIVDMPGASDETIDVSLENNTLSIHAASTHRAPEGYSLAFNEFSAGDYERIFRVTDQIDRDGIEAVFKDGVLTLTLPKAVEVKARKISVKAA